MCVRELQSPCSTPSLCDLAPERVLVHVVRERPHAVDLDDRQPLAVAGFEVGIGRDVHLVEPILTELGDERPARSLAQVAPARGVQPYG